jgi:excisionase family DNA binding protein
MTEVVFYTQKELAKVLHCSSRQISLLRQHGLISFIRVGQSFIYRKEDVDKFWDKYKGRDLNNESKIMLAAKTIK